MTNQVLKHAQCTALIHEAFCWGRTSTYLLLVILVGMRSNSQSLGGQSSVLPLSQFPSLAYDIHSHTLIYVRGPLGIPRVLDMLKIVQSMRAYSIYVTHTLTVRETYTGYARYTSDVIGTLADPGGGGHPARPHPNGRGPMIFLCPKR